jgi:hypothetical protein
MYLCTFIRKFGPNASMRKTYFKGFHTSSKNRKPKLFRHVERNLNPSPPDARTIHGRKLIRYECKEEYGWDNWRYKAD